MGLATSRSCTTCTLFIITSIALAACGGNRTSDEQSATSSQPPIVAPAPAPEPSPSATPPPAPEQPNHGCPSASSEQTLRNLAANRSYTLTPAPNYTSTNDSLDSQQLTDGRVDDNALWHDTGAVGWRSVRPVTITIDLGEVHSFSEVRWHSAAGSDDVKWPAAINVFVSSDGRAFRLLGDMVAADSGLAALPTDTYRAHTLRLTLAPTEARYVRLMADRDGSYIFTDEIEVLGPVDGESRPADSCSPISGKPSPPVEDTLAAFWSARAQRRAALALERDAVAIAERIALPDLAAAERRRLTDQLGSAAAAARDELGIAPLTSSRLPLNSSHQAMYAIAAAAERAAGASTLSIWPTNPWDPLDPLARPGGEAQSALSTVLMVGERRALTFNMRSSSAAPLPVALRISMPGLAPGDIELYRVNWTGNDESRWAAAELELLGDAAAQPEITLLPGITQQVWMRLRPTAASGHVDGAISIAARDTTRQLPLDVRVLAVQMPQALSMHFGGWDYSDGSFGHAVSASNRAKVIDYLRSSHVDTPWATRRVLHWNHLSSSGTVATDPDATSLEQWLRDWPTASRYRVFVSVRDAIGKISMTDPRFDAAVTAWAHSWARKIRNLGRSPEQFDLLLVDEPQSATQAAMTESWAHAIRGSGAGFRIWTDPHWAEPSAIPRDFLAAVDIVSLNLGTALRAGDQYWNWARDVQSSGKTVELYATSGPARLLDPYAYYRLAAWRAWSIGASAVTLWSFTATGESRSDHEFAAHELDYSPFFIGEQTVRPGKHMEAAVEGLQDVEYLHMLSAAAQSQSDSTVRAQIDDLLKQATQLAGAAREDEDTRWNAARERSRAERLRLQMGDLLESLSR